MSRLVHFSPTGSDTDGDGTVLNPFRTREEALFWATDDDELCCDSFVTNEEERVPDIHSADGPILLVAGCMVASLIGFKVGHPLLAFLLAAGVVVVLYVATAPRKPKPPRPGFRQDGWGKP